MLKITNSEGADVVADVAGKAFVIEEGLRMLARGGTYLETGSIVPKDTAKVDASILVGANQRILGRILISRLGAKGFIKLP